MTTIAFVSTPDPGHVLPVLGVARALRARGHRTVVVTGDQHAQLVADEGHTLVTLPRLPSHPDGDDFAYVLFRRPAEMAPMVRDALAPHGVSLVVTDTVTTVGAYVADMLGVDWVEVCPHHLVDPDPALAPIGLGAAPSRTRFGRLRDAQVRRAQQRSIDAGLVVRDEARTSIGLGDATSPRLRLLQTLPDLEPRRAHWPAEAHVVGSIAIDPPLPPLPVPDGDGPVVLVTDSTADSLDSSLGALALEGLTGRGYRLVVTTSTTGLRTAPDATVGRGAHGPLLELADVAVTPGGGGFTAKALVRGVPLVVMPIAGDQRETAGRVARSGAGVHLSRRRATAAGMAKAVRTVLDDPSHGVAARRLAASAAGLGPQHAADLVESVLAGAGRSGTR